MHKPSALLQTMIDAARAAGEGLRADFANLKRLEIKTKAGAFYSKDELFRDRLALQRFYGTRGFPAATLNPQLGSSDDPALFHVYTPEEIYQHPVFAVRRRLRGLDQPD